MKGENNRQRRGIEPLGSMASHTMLPTKLCRSSCNPSQFFVIMNPYFHEAYFICSKYIISPILPLLAKCTVLNRVCGLTHPFKALVRVPTYFVCHHIPQHTQPISFLPNLPCPTQILLYSSLVQYHTMVHTTQSSYTPGRVALLFHIPPPDQEGHATCSQT